jgi:hypothetical protein
MFSRRAAGTLWQTLDETASSANRSVPSGLPRMMLLFATGKVVQARLADQGVPDYVPFLYRDGLSG